MMHCFVKSKLFMSPALELYLLIKLRPFLVKTKTGIFLESCNIAFFPIIVLISSDAQLQAMSAYFPISRILSLFMPVVQIAKEINDASPKKFMLILLKKHLIM